MTSAATDMIGTITSQIQATSIAVCTRDEARLLTDQIKGTAEQLWRLLLEAHERQAWRALGYPSWREYAKTEFNMSQSQAYRLLDQGRVVRALEAAAGSPVGEIVSEREARDIKPNLALVTEEIRERIDHGDDPLVAVKTTITAARRPTYLSSLKRSDRSNRWMATQAADLEFVARAVDGIDVKALDAAYLPEWSEVFRTVSRAFAKFAKRLDRAVGAEADVQRSSQKDLAKPIMLHRRTG